MPPLPPLLPAPKLAYSASIHLGWLRLSSTSSQQSVIKGEMVTKAHLSRQAFCICGRGWRKPQRSHCYEAQQLAAQASCTAFMGAASKLLLFQPHSRPSGTMCVLVVVSQVCREVGGHLKGTQPTRFNSNLHGNDLPQGQVFLGPEVSFCPCGCASEEEEGRESVCLFIPKSVFGKDTLWLVSSPGVSV